MKGLISTRLFLIAAVLAVPLLTQGHGVTAETHTVSMTGPGRMARGQQPVPALADSELLRTVGIKVLAEDKVTGVAFTRLTPEDQVKLSIKAHEWGRCGGFEAVPMQGESAVSLFGSLRKQHEKNLRLERSSGLRGLVRRGMTKNPAITAAVSQVSEENTKGAIAWLSAFPTRYNKGPNPNDHVLQLKQRLEKMVSGAAFPIEIGLVDHQSTPQKTLYARIPGKSRASEIVIIGGHLDSISSSWFAQASEAPGADDNASGSSNLIEALRILSRQAQPERTIEIYWYAGEESGLLGSGEIARAYKAANKDVVAVLQLDMTLAPGDGEFVLGSMTDFTSAWLREHLKALNALYINAKIIEDRCGYGCSDHASWHRQGYPALMPHESSFRRSNRDIHTKNDVINSKSNFRHSAMFSKIAVAFAMDLANSTQRSP